MPDVFDITEAAGSEFFRDAVIAAAYELAVFDGVGHDVAPRLRLLLDVLVGYGILGRDGDGYRVADRPPRPTPATYQGMGWGAIADVIRRDRPLSPADGGADSVTRMHLHLARAGALAAQETAKIVGERSRTAPRHLVDLGGGAGAYTAAWLAEVPEARATLVDVTEVVPLARQHLAGYSGRVDFLASDIRDATISDASVALLANVVHLHGAATCAQLCKHAASMVGSGGLVAIKDLRMDVDAAGMRSGPLQSLLFALNMGIYTQDGDVHETSLLRSWLTEAGLVEIDEQRLEASSGAVVVMGRKP